MKQYIALILILFLASCVSLKQDKITKEVQKEPVVVQPEKVIPPTSKTSNMLLKELLEKSQNANEVLVSYDSEELTSEDSEAVFNSTVFLKGNNFRRDALIQTYTLEGNSPTLSDSQALSEKLVDGNFSRCILPAGEEEFCSETTLEKEEVNSFIDNVKDKKMMEAIESYNVSSLSDQTINNEKALCFKIITNLGEESSECYSEKTGFLLSLKTETEKRSLKNLEFKVPNNAFEK